MKNMTAEERALWGSSSQPKDLKIKLVAPDKSETIELDNSNLVSESLEITQILESGKTLSFGDANASSLKIKCNDIGVDVRGWGLTATLTLKNYPQYSVEVFDGYVESQTNQTHEDNVCQIVAYDLMKRIFNLDMTEWWESFRIGSQNYFSNYISVILQAICVEANCETISQSDFNKMANLYQVIETKPDLITDFTTISGEMLIKWIAQATNVYLTMDGKKLKAIKLSLMGEALTPHIGLHPSRGLYPRAGTYDKSFPKGEYISATYEPYKTEKIDQVIITDKGEIGEGQYPVQAEQGKNVLFLDGNPFLWSMNMMECAETIYNRVHDVYFTPSTIKCAGSIYMELGDVIRVTTLKNTIQSYILKRTIKGINAIKDTYTNKSQQYQTSHNPSYADVTDLQTQSILRIKADIVELNKLVAADISADRITTGDLDASKVTIKNLTVTDSMISGKITTQHLDSKVITTDNFSAQTISADKISGGTIDADKVKIKNLTVSEANISSISFGKLSGTISGSQISADIFKSSTITCSKLYSSGGGIKLGNYECAPSSVEVYCRRKNSNGTYSTYWLGGHWVKSSN